MVSPEIYSDEYISTEECAKRLGVTDQTIRNWILQGKKRNKTKGFEGWVQGVHYIVIPAGKKKQLVRILEPIDPVLSQRSGSHPAHFRQKQTSFI